MDLPLLGVVLWQSLKMRKIVVIGFLSLSSERPSSVTCVSKWEIEERELFVVLCFGSECVKNERGLRHNFHTNNITAGAFFLLFVFVPTRFAVFGCFAVK